MTLTWLARPASLSALPICVPPLPVPSRELQIVRKSTSLGCRAWPVARRHPIDETEIDRHRRQSAGGRRGGMARRAPTSSATRTTAR